MIYISQFKQVKKKFLSWPCFIGIKICIVTVEKFASQKIYSSILIISDLPLD